MGRVVLGAGAGLGAVQTLLLLFPLARPPLCDLRLILTPPLYFFLFAKPRAKNQAALFFGFYETFSQSF